MKSFAAISLTICISLAGCSAPAKPTLLCELSHWDGHLRSQVDRTLTATLTEFSSEGVWDFEGELISDAKRETAVPITGHFYQYDEKKFDLIASTDRERITIMPDNKHLQARGLQGVTMPPVGGHVTTGTPLSATCRTSLPKVGNQRYEVPEKQ